jgi:hypothetical protein
MDVWSKQIALSFFLFFGSKNNKNTQSSKLLSKLGEESCANSSYFNIFLAFLVKPSNYKTAKINASMFALSIKSASPLVMPNNTARNDRLFQSPTIKADSYY